MTFQQYLQQSRFSPNTIKTYERYRKYFMKWLATTGREAETLTYTDLLGYIKSCYEAGLTHNYINKLLGVVRHYYNYLKYQGIISDNPAAELYLRGGSRRLPHDLLSGEQLETMYNNVNPEGPAGKRNKVMLGLMIYQGVTPYELELLDPRHLKLKEGRIEIPGTRRSNGRTLTLASHQVIEMQEYVSRTRTLILEMSEKASEKLLVSTGSSPGLRGSLNKLVRHLRKKHSFFINLQQLRQSRIAIWVRHHDIRQVQYMAGHKYVSSTERYQQTNMEDLQQALNEHHPSQE